ncbi:class I SAM-dependent methyltransferase [Rubrimonas sp.]|uniref:class I SAM-dependent methyltransferase n=1 Tax=Rubrimonas sp. TaxID=2036015 RepID=UPI002FDE2BF8
MTPESDRIALRRATVASYGAWFHSIDLGDGVITPGAGPYAVLKGAADVYFADLSPCASVLDVGAWDGFFSIEAKRRGAGRVVAADWYVWWGQGAGPTASDRGFDIAVREAGLATEIEKRVIRLEDLDVHSVGTFDVVLFNGIWYHIRNPLSALEAMARIARSTLTIETVVDLEDLGRPAMVFYPGDVQPAGRPQNGWGPNRRLMEALLRDHGFDSVTAVPSPGHEGDRAIFVARRTQG